MFRGKCYVCTDLDTVRSFTTVDVRLALARKVDAGTRSIRLALAAGRTERRAELGREEARLRYKKEMGIRTRERK